MAVVPPKPALVPLTFDPGFLERYGELAGVSLDARTSCGPGRFRENLLFTHRGLSGPAILQISSYWQQAGNKEPIEIDLLPDEDSAALLRSHRRGKAPLHAVLSERMPKRFAERWCEERGVAPAMAELSDRSLEQAAHDLAHWRVQPTGTQGYNKAEVTLGGVDTRGLSSKTMESSAVQGLYFVGEAVDVTGHLGGFNFQWAWASAHAAGTAL
jgi:predicted Rossmann fold flavoprotein